VSLFPSGTILTQKAGERGSQRTVTRGGYDRRVGDEQGQPMAMPPGERPAFYEMGMGVDLFGEDQTKAAKRAVREAIGRTSLPGLRHLIPSGERDDMHVAVTVAVPKPNEVDGPKVAAEFPYGQVEVTAVEGGMRAPNGSGEGEGRDHLIIAVALVAVGW
jgi:uncharacterized protein (TIGR02058 family)